MTLYQCVCCGRIFREKYIPHKWGSEYKEKNFDYKELKILDLPLKAKWYNMIESGEKKEEYRELKPYWQKRLMECYYSG